MKKYILSFLIIGTFGLYVLYQHSNNTPLDIALNTPPVTVSTNNKLQNTTVTKTGNTSSVIRNGQTKNTNTIATSTTSGMMRGSGSMMGAIYKDGTYTGSSANAYYGNVQVEAVVSGGKLVDVKFLKYPNGRGNSVKINNYAMPLLKSEAISAQNANVNTVSGASYTSAAFKQSLAYALTQAKN